jgi:hypothetical protein
MRGQPGFFDIDDRLKRLSDQLEAFQSAVDFELFRPELNAVLNYTDRTEGGRPPFDPALMFKIRHPGDYSPRRMGWVAAKRPNSIRRVLPG